MVRAVTDDRPAASDYRFGVGMLQVELADNGRMDGRVDRIL